MFLKHLNKSNFQFSKRDLRLLLLVSILGVNLFYLGYNYAYFKKDKNTIVNDKTKYIYSLLKNKYLFYEKINEKQIEDGIIEGLVNSMGDPYTRYISQKKYKEFKTMIEGSFGGIGITLKEKNNEGVVIEDTIKDNPADKAGLQPNDIITEVNGQSVKNIDIEEIKNLIRGEIGTSVELTVKRKGEKEPIKIKIKRDNIEVPSVFSKKISNTNVGYVYISNFSNTSIKQFDEEYKKLTTKENIKSLIIDLRENPGGIVEGAIDLSSRFLNKNDTIVYIEGKNKEEKITVKNQPYKIDLPVIILVNENSASASEIFTAALKENNRAKVVGNKTFGKGLVQEIFPIDKESAVTITIAQYLTPNKNNIHLKGITPDFVVEQNSDTQDLQLKKALEIMKE